MPDLEPRSVTTPDGFRLAWYELGAGTVGPPIVLQHGFSSSTRDEWVESGIAASVASLGRRVVGIDALGHGRSDTPHEPRHYGEARMARDLGVLADHLGFEAFDLVGYSMGAIVALLAATGEPRIRRLAVGGVGEAVVLLGGVDTRALDNRDLAAVLRADDPSGYAPFLRGFRERAEQRGSDRLALAAHAQVVHAGPVPFERIAVPTLLIAGDADPLAANPRILADAIPGARLVIVTGDHGAARLAPQFTAALLDFLR
jgi:pimeloyl-ACP methyl ester carboxylesterase